MNLFALLNFNQFWLAIPLILAFSFVYAATRHEEMLPIIKHAAQVCGWTVFFIIVIFGILYFIV